MTTLTINIPDKFKNIVSDNNQVDKISYYIVEDYLTELYQDSQTKTELEKNSYDKELNNKIKSALWI